MDYFNVCPYQVADQPVPQGKERDTTNSGSSKISFDVHRHRPDVLLKPLSQQDSVCSSLPRSIRRRLARHKMRSIAGGVFLLTLARGTSDAATILVTTTELNTLTNGKCSFLEAIANANNDSAPFPDCAAGSGADTIILPANSRYLIRAASYVGFYGDTGTYGITSPITIEGNGATFSRPTSKVQFRLFVVMQSGNLTIRNVILKGGREEYGGAIFNAGRLTIEGAKISGAAAVAGGAVFNAPTGTLTITDSTLSGHAAVGGGAVFNYQGSVKIEDSTISENHAEKGGGLSSYAGTLEIENSTITHNKASEQGGGVHGREAVVEIKNSIISKNTADVGGGVLNYSGTFNVENSVITSNKASSRGGGTQSWNGEFTIESSEISKNSAMSAGGVGTINFVSLNINNSIISNNSARFDSGGLMSWAGNVTITNSTLSNNRAGAMGGGLGHFSGSLFVDNTTISGNLSRSEGGGVWNQGISQITNTTITGNTAAKGGGLYSQGNNIVLQRNLISGNKAGSGAEVAKRVPDSNTVIANDFNLFGVGNNAGIVGFSIGATDIVPSGPIGSILAPLADNGGPTPTHALVAGSRAIDAVPSVLAECSGTDQRGVGRPQGAGCDSGAFEK